jgi:uncharacterized protein (TIGR02265 family)
LAFLPKVMPSFVAPDWDAPLDADAFIRAVPASAVIKGMYSAAIAVEAKRRGLTLTHAGEKYVPFLDYPMRDHLNLLVEAARMFSPELSLRRSLRKLGRGAVGVLLSSTLGRAVLGGLTQPETTARAILGITRAYATALGKPTPQAELKETGETSCILRLSDFWLFLDSHQIGILEGMGRSCGVRIEVEVALESSSKGELACSWEVAPLSRPSFV